MIQILKGKQAVSATYLTRLCPKEMFVNTITFPRLAIKHWNRGNMSQLMRFGSDFVLIAIERSECLDKTVQTQGFAGAFTAHIHNVEAQAIIRTYIPTL